MCNNSCSSYKIGCLAFIPAILVVLLSFVVGLFIGAMNAGFIVENMVAISVLGFLLLLALVIWIIARYCRCRNR